MEILLIIIGIISIIALIFSILAYDLAKHASKNLIKTTIPYGEDINLKRNNTIFKINLGIIRPHSTRAPLDEYDYHTTSDKIKKFLNKDIDIVLDIETTKDKLSIINSLNTMLKEKVSVILIIGGTGFSDTDKTIEAVESVAIREMKSFPSYFHDLHKGPTTLLLGNPSGYIVVNDKNEKVFVFCIPGNQNAMEIFVKGILNKGIKINVN